MRWRYNAFNFLKNIHKRHPITRPLGRGKGCLLWIQNLIDILPQSLQLFTQHLNILDRFITALDYIYIYIDVFSQTYLAHERLTIDDVKCKWYVYIPAKDWTVSILTLRQNGRHFADDILKRIFLNENRRISIKISLKFIPKGPISNIPALVQIMAWCWAGDKPLSEPMATLLTDTCVPRPQWGMD